MCGVRTRECGVWVQLHMLTASHVPRACRLLWPHVSHEPVVCCGLTCPLSLSPAALSPCVTPDCGPRWVARKGVCRQAGKGASRTHNDYNSLIIIITTTTTIITLSHQHHHITSNHHHVISTPSYHSSLITIRHPHQQPDPGKENPGSKIQADSPGHGHSGRRGRGRIQLRIQGVSESLPRIQDPGGQAISHVWWQGRRFREQQPSRAKTPTQTCNRC